MKLNCDSNESQHKHKLAYVNSKIALSSIAAIVLIVIAGLLQPSVLTLTIFLAALSLTGFQFAGLFLKSAFVRITVAPLAGLSIAVLSLLIPFATMEKMPLAVQPYLVRVILGVNLVLMVIHFFSNRRQKSDSNDNIGKVPSVFTSSNLKIVLILFFIAVLVRLLFQFYNSSSILPDASLYYSAGRSLAESGEFSANVLNDALITSPYSRVYGLIPRGGTWMILGTFFSFGGVSFEINKLMLVVFGSLLIFPAMLLSKLWVGKRIWIAGILIAFQPTLLFFSAFPFGSEILSTAFSLSAIAILEFSRIADKEHTRAILLAAIFLGVSAIIWEPLFILLFLVPYVISLAITTDTNIGSIISLLVLTILLELTVLYSSTWQFNPLIFVVATLVCAFLVKKWSNRLFYHFLIFVSIGIFFFLFLSRWYLFPDLVITPSLEYAGRAALTNYMPLATSFDKLSSSANLYYNLSTQAYTQFILILGLLSLLIQPWKTVKKSAFAYLFLLTHIIVLIFMLGPGRGLINDYGATRFFLGATVLIVILASGAVARLFDVFIEKYKDAGDESNHQKSSNTNLLKKRFFKHTFSPFVKTIFMILIILIALLPGVIEFYTRYNQTLSYGQAINYPKTMGVLDSMEWIKSNTSSGDIFLVASGQTAHVWSMQIGDRYFASLQIVKNETVVPFKEIELSDILASAHDLNASYIIFDSTLSSFSLEKLLPLYKQLEPEDVGMTFPVFPENLSLEYLTTNEHFHGLRVLFVSVQGNSKVIIFKQVQLSLKSVWYDDFKDSTNWGIYLNGTLGVDEDNLVLTTPPFCKDKVYAEHIFEQNLTITNSTFIMLKVSMQDQGTKSGFYIHFKEGKNMIMTFDEPGTYSVNIGEFEGLTPNIMFLYDMLSSSITNTNESYTVSYDWVLLTDMSY